MRRWCRFIVHAAVLGSALGARADYGFPVQDRYEATVFGTPPGARAPLPRSVPVEVRSIRLYPERAIPEVLWAVRDLRYSAALQSGPAPLVFLIAGTGARFDSGKNAFLQKALFGAGFSVVNLSSPTHPEFIVAGSRSSVPGVMADDVRDLYTAMQRIRDELATRAKFSAYYLTGYSLGGTQAAYIGELDERERAIGFEKILLLNPAVSLYASVQRLDQMLTTNLPGGAAQLNALVDQLLAGVALYLRKEGRPPLDAELMYNVQRTLELDDAKRQALIAVSFRLSLAGMLFTSDVMTDSRQLVEPGKELTIDSPLLPYLKAGARWSFADYLDAYLLPYRARHGEPLDRAALIEQDSLYPIQDYLRRSGRIALMTNEDDLILDAREVDFLRRTFGARATLYPSGGHCGNLMYRENVAQMIAFFRGPVQAVASPGPAPRIPAPPQAEPVLGLRIPPAEAAHIQGFLDESDPIEGMNRRIYRFNAAADRWVLLPLVRGYRFVVPTLVRAGIHNVFETLDDATTFANEILQVRPRDAGETLGRVLVNLTVGVAGLYDAATPAGIPDHEEDFGQTLGVWGLGTGPYLVVPLLGPSSLRDAPGKLVDAIPFALLGIPPWYVRPVQVADARDTNPFRYGELGIPFEYVTVRFLALERERQLTASH